MIFIIGRIIDLRYAKKQTCRYTHKITEPFYSCIRGNFKIYFSHTQFYRR